MKEIFPYLPFFEPIPISINYFAAQALHPYSSSARRIVVSGIER
jgi:hypothetical protein